MQQSGPALWRDAVQVRAVGRVRAGLIGKLAAEIGGRSVTAMMRLGATNDRRDQPFHYGAGSVSGGE